MTLKLENSKILPKFSRLIYFNEIIMDEKSMTVVVKKFNSYANCKIFDVVYL